jgi:predicted ATPase
MVAGHLQHYDSMLSEVADPEGAPEVLRVREQVRSWRFYDHFATDSAARHPYPDAGRRRLRPGRRAADNRGDR